LSNVKKTTFKELVDPCFQMIPTTQKWDKITNELHKITKVKVLHDEKTCKNKWNNLIFYYKIIM
jgi:hypothetical protein